MGTRFFFSFSQNKSFSLTFISLCLSHCTVDASCSPNDQEISPHGINSKLPNHVLYNSLTAPPSSIISLIFPHPFSLSRFLINPRLVCFVVVVALLCTMPEGRSTGPQCPRATDHLSCSEAPPPLLSVLTHCPQTGRPQGPPQSLLSSGV